MKKPYEEPEVVIELFPGEDVIICSIIEEPEDPDPIVINSTGGGSDA